MLSLLLYRRFVFLCEHIFWTWRSIPRKNKGLAFFFSEAWRLSLFYVFLWGAISSFLIGFWLWSIYVLYRQKVTWRAYAQSRKMRYEGGGFYDSPRISGKIGGYKVEAFTADHSEFDARTQRRLSSVEVSLKTVMPSEMLVATGGMVAVLKDLPLQQEYKPEFTGWDDSYVVRTQEEGAAMAYLTDERMQALLTLTKIKKAWLVLIFYGGQGLLRLDLPDPVVEPKRLDILLKKMVEVAGILELGKGEEISIIRKSREIRDGQSKIHIDEDDESFAQGLELELEDDGVGEGAAADVEVVPDEKAGKGKKPASSASASKSTSKSSK